jgi:hypothetical protein
MKADVFQAALGELFNVWSIAWPTERGGGAKAGVVDQNDEHIWCPVRRAQRADRRIFGVGIFGVVGRQSDILVVWDWKYIAREAVAFFSIARADRLPTVQF